MTAWESYRQSVDGPIDLAGADLHGAELKDRVLANCDMSAANLTDANLDGAQFRNTKLSATVLDNSSLVRCSFVNTNFSHSNISRSVIRLSTFRRCAIENLDVQSGFIGECTITDSQISNLDYAKGTFVKLTLIDTRIAELKGAACHLSGCRFERCSISGMNLYDSIVEECCFDESALSDSRIQGPQFSKNSLTRCQISRFAIGSENVSDLDLTASALRDVVLSDLGLPTAVLLDTAVTGCQWPAQRGRVTLTGRYIPNSSLLRQPVQDLKGVPPLIRRDIADSQYLVTRLAHRPSFPDTILMRLWGCTSAYGQSLTRLLACSAIAILFDAAALVLATGRECETFRKPIIFIDVLGAAARSFVGIGVTSNLFSSLPAEILIIAARIAGFAALGVWIAVAAQKISRLSSE
jgi:uncharacterized protein YjbI with pentapeptide repeats